MKKTIALLLALVLTLALCACTPKETVVGTWKADINLADAFNEEIAAGDETMAEYMKLESFVMPLILELKEDGTCTMKVDETAMTATMDKLVQDLTAGLEAYFTDYFASMGMEIDLNEALAAAGMSLDDLVAEMKNQFAGEDTFAAFTTESKYKAEDCKLYFSDDLETEINTDEYNTYTLDGDTLTLEIGTMDAEEDMVKYMFPMTLTRVK